MATGNLVGKSTAVGLIYSDMNWQYGGSWGGEVYFQNAGVLIDLVFVKGWSRRSEWIDIVSNETKQLFVTLW